MALALGGDDLARSVSKRSFKKVWQQEPDVFRGAGEREDEEEEELRWAALERLPTYDRISKGFLRKVLEDGTVKADEIDVKKLRGDERRYFMNRILDNVERDNERLLQGLRNRIDR